MTNFGPCVYVRYVRTMGNAEADIGGCYFGLPDVDPWDEQRDARRYDGPWPVVAHTPCQRWGKLWAGQPLSSSAPASARSRATTAAASPQPGRRPQVGRHHRASVGQPCLAALRAEQAAAFRWLDSRRLYGGWTCCVEQGRYGHYARKPTLLLAYGCELPELDWGIGEPRLRSCRHRAHGPRLRAKRLAKSASRAAARTARRASARQRRSAISC
jgi:hypothetical protein